MSVTHDKKSLARFAGTGDGTAIPDDAVVSGKLVMTDAFKTSLGVSQSVTLKDGKKEETWYLNGVSGKRVQQYLDTAVRPGMGVEIAHTRYRIRKGPGKGKLGHSYGLAVNAVVIDLWEWEKEHLNGTPKVTRKKRRAKRS